MIDYYVIYVLLLFLLLYCLLCNVGLRHQDLSHLNRTHKKEKKILYILYLKFYLISIFEKKNFFNFLACAFVTHFQNIKKNCVTFR